MKFTEPEIVLSDSRSYVWFYLNGERKRVYSGKDLGIPIFPNRATNRKEKLRRLEALRKELLCQLASETYGSPIPKEEYKQDTSIRGLLTTAYQLKMDGPYSDKYKRDITEIYNAFLASFSTNELKQKIEYLTLGRINTFLQKYNTSGTYYTRKRSDLRILVNYMFKLCGKPSFMGETLTIRSEERAHMVYDREDLDKVLAFLKDNNFKLYVCCLLTYGCWLRPHVEIRNLRVSSFSDDFKYIRLSGSQVKNKKNRIVYVPDFVRNEILNLNLPDADVNIFSRTNEAPNEYYFSTQFGRIKKRMIEENIIKPNHTIYSFRHTAALDLFNKTKNVATVMSAMAHSSISVTERYLRSIGKVNLDEITSNAPEAPGFLKKVM